MHSGILPIKIAFASGLFLSACTAAYAKEDGLPDSAPKIFQEVVDCRAIADPAARLTCYDTNVAKLDDAQKKNELFVADKAQVRETRKGLFGLSLPKIKLFGKGDDADEIKEVNAVIASVSNDSKGNLVFTLEDGAVWKQTDQAYFGRPPAAGTAMNIKMGSVGAYWAKIGDKLAIKVRRILD